MKSLVYLERWPREVSVTVGFALVALVGAVDFLTGYDLWVFPFSFFAIFILAWCAGPWVALAGASMATLLRTTADLVGLHASPSQALLYGNAALRLAVLAAMALLLSALKRLVDEQRALASTDHLTGAANARAFEDALQREMDRARRYGRRFTVAYFDLDKFKTINDTLGHAEGDAVLRTLVNAVHATTRSSDIVGRIGGDEFALLLPETDHDHAAAAVEKVRAGIVHDFRRRGWDVTVSVGSYTGSDQDTGVEEVIRKADRRMYEAKMKGRGVTRRPPFS